MAKRLLLADDSVTIQKVVELAFLEEDFEVIAFATGDEALAALESGESAILVCDIHMPGTDGYEICQRAKSVRDGLPVLLLVGTFEAFDDDRYESSGADGYLRKPFDSQELVRKVKQLVTDDAEDAGAPASSDDAGDDEGSFVQTFEAIDPSRPATEEVAPDVMTAEAVAPEAAIETEIPDVTLPPHEAAAAPEAEAGEKSGGDEHEPAIFDTLASDKVTAEPADLSGPTEQLPTIETPSPEPQQSAPPPPAPVAEPAPAPTERAPVEPEPEAPEVPAVREEAPAASPTPPLAAEAASSLSDEDVERIARRVAELLSESVIREIAWEVVPDLAEVVVKERLDDLERQVEEL
jgi:CheY-like chemotaxis protein